MAKNETFFETVKKGVGTYFREKKATADLARMINEDKTVQKFHTELLQLSGRRGVHDQGVRLNTKELLAGYSKFPWLRAVTDKIGEVVSSVEWETTFRGEPQKNHPMTQLLANGNPLMAGTMVRKLTTVHLALVGEAFWLKQRNMLGVPAAIWPIPPHWVVFLPHENHYRPNHFRLNIYGTEIDVPENEMVHFYEPDPVQPYGRGTGRGGVLADELETDEFASKHLKAFFRNNARPDMVIYSEDSENPISQDDAKRLEREWVSKLRGIWRSHRPFFMPGKVNIKEIQSSLRDMQMLDLRRFQRDIVLNIYGIPPEALGILESSNRATVEAAEFFLSKHVALPRLRHQRNILRAQLLPDFDSRLDLQFASPVEEDKVHQLRVMRSSPYAFKVDEIRAAAELPPLDNEDGKRHPISSGVRFVDSLSELAGAEGDEGNNGNNNSQGEDEE